MSRHIAASGRGMQKNVGMVILMALAVLLADPSFGQQARPGEAAKQPATRKKPAGRLPTYFSAVVSPQQRQQIYKLQAGYAVQLEQLQAQMDALIANRDREVEGVLNPEQLAEVNKKREEAKRKRAARSSSKSKSPKTTEG